MDVRVDEARKEEAFARQLDNLGIFPAWFREVVAGAALVLLAFAVVGVAEDREAAQAAADGAREEVEEEIVDWLTAGGVILSPDTVTAYDFPGVPIGTSDVIMEVSRTPLQLVWSIADDAFTRYVVHCCARYHDVVSFSTFHLTSGSSVVLIATCVSQARTTPASASRTSSAPTSPALRTTPSRHSTPLQ